MRNFKTCFFYTLCLLHLIVLGGCSRKQLDTTPAKVLESYIKLSFNVTDVTDKLKMEELLTGDTKTRLASWSDEQFAKAFLESKRKFQALKILETKKVNEEEVALTYELSFQEGPNDNLAQITQRKLCSVIQKEGVWKIKEVRSIRESIEYLKELSLP